MSTKKKKRAPRINPTHRALTMRFAAEVKRRSGLSDAAIEAALGIGGLVPDGSSFGKFRAGARTPSLSRLHQLVKAASRDAATGKGRLWLPRFFSFELSDVGDRAKREAEDKKFMRDLGREMTRAQAAVDRELERAIRATSRAAVHLDTMCCRGRGMATLDAAQRKRLSNVLAVVNASQRAAIKSLSI